MSVRRAFGHGARLGRRQRTPPPARGTLWTLPLICRLCRCCSHLGRGRNCCKQAATDVAAQANASSRGHSPPRSCRRSRGKNYQAWPYGIKSRFESMNQIETDCIYAVIAQNMIGIAPSSYPGLAWHAAGQIAKLVNLYSKLPSQFKPG